MSQMFLGEDKPDRIMKPENYEIKAIEYMLQFPLVLNCKQFNKPFCE